MNEFQIIQLKERVLNEILDGAHESMRTVKWWEFMKIRRIRRINDLALIKLINLDCK
mgnify:CR=1 FL=1